MHEAHVIFRNVSEPVETCTSEAIEGFRFTVNKGNFFSSVMLKEYS